MYITTFVLHKKVNNDCGFNNKKLDSRIIGLVYRER